MTDNEELVPLAESERRPLGDARVVDSPDPDEEISVTVLVRRRPTAPAFEPAYTADSPGTRSHLSHEVFAETYGAERSDLERVVAFARAHKLSVQEASVPRRSVVLRGRLRDLTAAFGVELKTYDSPAGRYRGREGYVRVPTSLAEVIQGVFGLDNRPQAEPHLRLAEPGQAVRGFTAPEVAELYNYPAGVDGTGECIGIIELGGGFNPQDLDAYFNALGLNMPAVIAVKVDGAQNNPGLNSDYDAEVALDIEIVGAIAPGAKCAVYFAPNSDQGFLDAVTSAIHDATNRPSVISISWGLAEARWTKQAQGAIDQAFRDAAVLGITICTASGDHGSADKVDDGRAHVHFPASSPHVLACGGTHLQSDNNTIVSEVTWNQGDGWASGGGVSDTFDLPDYQRGANVPASVNADRRIGRGVPDVAGNADPTTGYRIRLNRANFVAGGTSAVAPLWAALIALVNQAAGIRVGFLNGELYRPLAAHAFHDVTQGTNAVPTANGYSAREGWDACTGLGTPNGTALLRYVRGLQSASWLYDLLLIRRQTDPVPSLCGLLLTATSV